MWRYWKTSPSSWHTIDASEWSEVTFWAGTFGVSREELLRAIRYVGGDPDAVRRRLHAYSPTISWAEEERSGEEERSEQVPEPGRREAAQR